MKRTESMIYPVRRFKSLALALKELEPFIRDGAHLQSGRPFEQLHGMRSREAVANWLLCVVSNFAHGSERMSFTSDPTGGDGVIHDSQTQMTWKTEHVMVRRSMSFDEKQTQKPVETQVAEAVSMKQAKGGAAYASGKQLVVFVDCDGGTWYPNRAAKQIPQPLLFDDVWVVSLHGPVEREYVYSVSQMDVSTGTAPTWLVRIAEDFQSWTVTVFQ